MNYQNLTQTLVESFNALADEVQNLTDRQTVLEHKLRYAHEQFQHLADKYAPAATEISETLLNLQIPPELHNLSLANTNLVPLPKRKTSDSKHQIAVIIREGRHAASSLTATSKSSRSSRDSFPPTTMTTLSTILEQDFTVKGRKGNLDCPFSQPAEEKHDEPHHSQAGSAPQGTQDPICAAMNDDPTSQPAASKCPIRYMDQHSPEEIAHYLETHKHELPRSHEVCVRRYQKNEEHIRKLDAKYGNLANMVEGLSRIHQPMLPEQDTRPQSDVERTSHDRVETWAQTISATATDDPDRTALEHHNEDDLDRQSHFDRPLKEVRVGESPSRPWGISVPVYDTPDGDGLGRPESPPPAPVQIPSSMPPQVTPAKSGKCPFDHTKLSQMMNGSPPAVRQGGKSSIRHGDIPASSQASIPAPGPHAHATSIPPQPTFINPAELEHRKQDNKPQMLFTGPVFIGYPMEDAIRFMQSFQDQQ